MRGFILAAGFGTRLRPITDHLPKALVPLAGNPLLHYALDFLDDNGIATIGVNTHYMPELIHTYQKSSSIPFSLFHEQPDIRGTGGALHFARSFLQGEDIFIVVNVDIVARFNLQEHLQDFIHSNDVCRLLAWENKGGTGTIVYNPDGNAYVGVATEASDVQNTVTADFIGMALYRKEFLDVVKPEDFSIIPVWQRAINRGMVLSVGVINNGYWRDIGTPASLAQAHFDVIDGTLPVPLPASLVVDRERMCCYPTEWHTLPSDTFGWYCWIEEPTFHPEKSIERSVVFTGANSASPRLPASAVYTQWGEIPFDA